MASGQAVEGIIITNRYVPPVCEGCVLGKLKRNEFPTSNREPVAEVGRLIAADVGGPMQEPSLSGARYYVLFKDKCSGYRKVYFIKTKAEAAGKFRLFIPFFQNETGKIIKTLLTDGGGEFKGGDWTWVEELGIRRLYTVPYSPQQNGSVERDNRSVVEARSAMYGMKIPVSPQVLLRLWAEAVAYSVYTLNRTLSRTRSVTPFEKYYGIKPNFSHLRRIACSYYVKIRDEKRRKWDPKGEKALFLGYDDTSTGNRVLTLNKLRVVISLDVVFIETESPAPLDQQHPS